MFSTKAATVHKKALLLALTLFISACDNEPPPAYQCPDYLGCVHIADGEPIKIGVLQALSGKVATLGHEQVRGIELALQKRNNKVMGHPISLQTEDTGCTAEGGANAVLKIIADPQHVAILGTTCSGAAATASKAMSEAGLSMISGNNSAPFLTSTAGKRAPDWQNGYFRTSNNEENAGTTAATFAYQELNIRKVATINDGDIYTKGLTDGFAKAFQDEGGEIVLNTSINKGDAQVKPVLTAVLDSEADLLFFPLFQPEGNYILLQAQNMPGFEKKIFMGDGALINSSFISEVGDLGKGMYFVGPAPPVSSEAKALAKAYEAQYKSPPSTSYYLTAFDSANLLFDTIEKIATHDSEKTLHIGRQALRDTLYRTENFQGVSGSLTCDKFGDCARPAFNILQLENPEAGVEALEKNVIFSSSPVNK